MLKLAPQLHTMLWRRHGYIFTDLRGPQCHEQYLIILGFASLGIGTEQFYYCSREGGADIPWGMCSSQTPGCISKMGVRRMWHTGRHHVARHPTPTTSTVMQQLCEGSFDSVNNEVNRPGPGKQLGRGYIANSDQIRMETPCGLNSKMNVAGPNLSPCLNLPWI